MRNHDVRARVRGLAALAALGAIPLTTLVLSSDAHAQIAGTTNRPLPNVLLLVDTSGSMERMADNSLPAENRNAPVGTTNVCSPGMPSNPNRWGMLLQALTGNLAPYYSCDAVQRNTAAFKNEFKIGSPASEPYDADYFLPYHRPLSGPDLLSACTFAPYTLPGAGMGAGVGPMGRGVNTSPYDSSQSFPPDAFVEVRNQHLKSQYASNSGLSLGANACTFEQANDGQLDAARDYIRFALMTFDNDPSNRTGVLGSNPAGGAVDTANPFLGQWSYVKSASNPLSIGMGLPAGCTTGATPFEVGARHWAAPPWEGRMIPFPSADGTLYDIQTTNEQIQKVLLGTRPYGATPIDGMIEDARDYFWYSDVGPLGSNAQYHDPYVASQCRDQYIILLTDGAPNMDLRPSCEGAGPPAGQCPFPSRAAQVANELANAPGNRRVKTFVIGFSVNGAGNTTFANDGFPAAYAAPNNNCKAWYNGVTSNGANPNAMHTLCTGGSKPAAGSTADACCQLAEIAYNGTPSGDPHVPPFFAETQADLVLSFGRILGGVSKTATTRTLPGYSPAVTINGQGVSADFIASFVPNAQKVWSGEIDRTRSVCAGATPTAQTQSIAAGDSYSANLAAQAAAGKRIFVTARAPMAGGYIDSARTLRPWSADTTGYTDSIPDVTNIQTVYGADMALASTANWAEALDITNNTCKRSRAVDGSTIPALNANDCMRVAWGFATAHAAAQGPLTFGGYDFNARCRSSASTTSGFCSVTTTTSCSVLGANVCPAGEVCVPECSALGAIYRSSPVIIGPPNELLRDEAYRQFAAQRAQRRPTMFVASTDGVLHAFKALSSAGPPQFDDRAGEHELWAFIPPAVLPKLASNYPTGQQILLDGTPAVKDIVWDRRVGDTDFNASTAFHTTLVAGMGAGGGGYYALNVTDVDCAGATPGAFNATACFGGGAITVPSTFAQLRTNPTGPQFLWQLTDVVKDGGADPAKASRRARDGTEYVKLFGKESGNATLATLQVDPNDGRGARQIGVAILPGGIDSPPVQGRQCQRAIFGGAQAPFAAGTFDASDNVTPFAPRTFVRQWGVATGAQDPCKFGPVPGRSVTIVRADTGEVIRHFGRVGQDVPARLVAGGKVTNSPFDSPVIGTPAVYPSGVGVTAQKIFVGDADGTIWRIDVSSANPNDWRVTLFQDLISVSLPGSPGAAQSQPVQVPPVISLDPFGGIVVSAATGDQENVIASANERNYVFSIQEQRALSPTQPGRALVRWYQPFTNAERVTGPMTVFDRTLYFATYRPVVPSGGGAACQNGGRALLWGMDYFNPQGGTAAAAAGGVPRWCPIGRVDAVTGACLDPLVANEDPAAIYSSLTGAIIPGVTLRATQACATFSGATGDPLITGMTSSRFELFFGATTSRSTGSVTTGAPQAARTPLLRPLPRTTASIDAWAYVID